MDRAPTDPISFQRNVILGLLLALAAAAWAALVWQGAGADMDMAMNLPTMGLRAPLFLAIWVTMMVAMMFPTAAPMILTFHKVQAGKRQRGEAFVSTWIFVAAYLLVWSLSGVAAYAGWKTIVTFWSIALSVGVSVAPARGAPPPARGNVVGPPMGLLAIPKSKFLFDDLHDIVDRFSCHDIVDNWSLTTE